MFWLCLILVVLAGLLAMPLAVPIGPMYWDTYIYLDATQRIKMGQIPGADFSTPVRPIPPMVAAKSPSFSCREQ
uniref:Hypothetical membrane spanning protein n=1 Tax=Brucella abortus TaxID=235 RepID=Q52JK7_BRUAO|nr:hypothetical membrane spanning protein [Brucella abortus]